MLYARLGSRQKISQPVLLREIMSRLCRICTAMVVVLAVRASADCPLDEWHAVGRSGDVLKALECLQSNVDLEARDDLG